MQMQAQVFETVGGEFDDDKGQKQPWLQLQVMDLQAPKKEVINLKVHKDLFASAREAINRAGMIVCSFSAATGKVSFHSFTPAKV